MADGTRKKVIIKPIAEFYYYNKVKEYLFKALGVIMVCYSRWLYSRAGEINRHKLRRSANVSWFSTNKYFHDDSRAYTLKYAAAATELSQKEMIKPSLETIQGYILVS